jgi:hypothetical protein
LSWGITHCGQNAISTAAAKEVVTVRFVLPLHKLKGLLSKKALLPHGIIATMSMHYMM